MADIVLDHVTKVYGNGVRAVTDLSLEVGDGELVVVAGPPASGRSTVLRMIAGLEEVTSGELRIAGRRVNEEPARDRDLAMVFPSYALYPHLSVADNIGFGLQLRRLPKNEVAARVLEAARTLGLEDVLAWRPKQLSGSQRQRVALGRALVREARALLLDEPLANLDPSLRGQMRAQIARLQQDRGLTTVYATHDQAEALTLGDRVAVLARGYLQQVATPETLYDSPDNLVVATFIGAPLMNVAQATLHEQDTAMSVELGGQTLALDPELVAERPALRNYTGDKVAVGVRAEQLRDAARATDWPVERRLRARVLLVEALGSHDVVHVGVDAPRVTVDGAQAVEPSDRMFDVGPGATAFAANFPPRSRLRAGDDVEVAVDTSHLHFFDLESGLAIRA